MANIIKIEKNMATQKTKNCSVEHECIWETGLLNNGEKCVILKTYNPFSENASVSQTLHITKFIAKQLIDILSKEFNL